MNRLQYESSPYLRQHAHNPVDWYAWGAEALDRARREDKPILVSIGYSTCHWCHVMERESFEDADVAALMNAHFVCIKIDREERPDLDAIYMEACQAVTGSGGWPLNCFLLPDTRPFFAGTYYPPQMAYQRPSWRMVLENLARAFREQRETVNEQAEKLTELIKNTDNQLLSRQSVKQSSANSVSLAIFEQLQTRFDVSDGGFGGAPKFPSSMALGFLVVFAQHFPEQTKALEHAERSLLKMIGGGIYDVLDGGFSRYTVDKAWLVPHFEKMLYDNALIVSTLAEAYQVSKRPIYRQTIAETLDFVERKMTAPDGGFYAAYDADSEGEEGKYYVWTMAEIEQIIDNPTDSHLFCELYDVTEEGNFEEKNILNRPDLTIFERLTDDEKKSIEDSRQKLLAAREKRVPPSLDDKQILAWNALMVTAYAQAYEATQIDKYRYTAVRQLDFLLHTFAPKTGDDWAHTHSSSVTKGMAFADDLAFLAESCLAVAQISGENNYLTVAERLINTLLTQFLDSSSFLYYFTSEKQTDVLVRKKEIYDNATPSANSTLARVLCRLSILLDRPDWRTLAEQMYAAVEASVRQYPTAFGRWAMGLLALEKPVFEIAIVGERALALLPEVLALASPQKIVQATTVPNEAMPLLRGRFVEGDTLIYVCQNYACQLPVRTVAEVQRLLE